jgi:hypothetical protein
MPKIPLLQSNVKESAIANVQQSANATAASFGLGQAQNMGKAADAVLQISTDLTVKAEEAKARDSVNKAQLQLNDTIQNNLYSRKGLEAATPEEAQAEFDKIQEANMPSGYLAKQLYQASVDSHKTDLLKNVQAHRAKEIETFNMATIDANSALAVDTAVRNNYDPEMVAKSKADIIANTSARYHGMGTEYIKAQTAAAVSNLHSSIMEARKAESPRSALNYLHENEQDFDPVTAAKMKEALKPLVENEQALETAKALDNVPLDQAQKQIDSAGLSPEASQKAMNLVKDRRQVKEYAKQDAQRKMLEGVADDIIKDPVGANIPIALDSAHWQDMYNFKQKLIGDARGVKTITDPAVYQKLTDMSQKELAEANLLDKSIMGGLSASHLTKWQDLQKKARENDPAFQTVQSVNSFVTTFARSQLPKSQWNTPEGKKLESEMLTQFEERLNQEPEGERKKRPTLQKVADELAMEVYTKGKYWGTNETPAWKAKANKLEVVGAKKPDGVPEDANWVESKLPDGKVVRGWQVSNPNGVRYIYDMRGNKMLFTPNNKVGAR